MLGSRLPGGALCCLLAALCAPAHAGRIIVRDAGGRPVAPLEAPGKRGAVLLFVTPDCPIANAYAPEIKRIARAYGQKGVDFYLVYADPSVGAAAVRQHVRAYGFGILALLDPGHRLVQVAHATTTPEAALIARGGRLLYHGRIDNRFFDFGKERAHITSHELRDALDALLTGRPSPRATAPAIGCMIPAAK